MIKDKEMILDKESILDKETIKEMIQEMNQEMVQEMNREMNQRLDFFPRISKDKLVAIGKVSSDGTLLKGTRGVTVSTIPVDGMYKVSFSEGLVQSKDYIVQLTAENYYEDSDHAPSTIGLHYQGRNGFNVSIWGSKLQTTGESGLVPVQVNWHFTIYERRISLVPFEKGPVS